ncbi:MAG: tetratricopeptide repeat protein, partial [Verrucomicrobiaceae bacterium]
EWRARYGSGGEDLVDFLTGMIRFSRSEYADAAALFQRSASAAGNLVQNQRALYNMGISALKGALPDEYARAISQLQPRVDAGTDAAAVSTVMADLAVERAMHLAARRDAGAEDALREFSKSSPEHPRCMEAQIGLAEFCLLDLPPRAKSARAALDAAAACNDKSPRWRERLDYARVWLQEAEENFAGVTEEGLKFIQSWPKSPHRDEVRMKIAQACYRQEDFPKARAQFELVEDEHADSPYAEVAQFFAAKSALSTLNAKDLDKALELFGEVVQRGGPLSFEARRQQALIKRLQGSESEALGVIESLLTARPQPEGESLVSLLVEKGELLALLVKEDPKKLEEAADVFRGVTQNSAATRFWRVRAGVLFAQSLQRLGKSSEAIEACHDVIDRCLAAEQAQPLTPQEHTWLYRAGFLAIEILEAQKQWEAAALMADRLAISSGERAKEAKDMATRIRLEHFLWDK